VQRTTSSIPARFLVVALLAPVGLVATGPLQAMDAAPPPVTPAVAPTEGIPMVVTAEAMAGFGGALAVWGEEVLVGEGANSLRPGKVYVYRRDETGAWEEWTRLTGGDSHPGDGFGSALTTDGNRLLVSATRQDDGRGMALVFRREGDEWVEAARLRASGLEDGDGFGASVALAGDWAFVGAPRRDGNRGGVAIFRFQEGEWTRLQILETDDGEEGDRFGVAVAADGGTLLVGAPGRASREGTVYVAELDRDTGYWSVVDRLSAGSSDAGGALGSAVALKGDRAVLTAPQANGGTGIAVVFQRDGTTGGWTETGRLLPFDAPRQGTFGAALTLTEEGEVWIGAPRASGGSGAVYHFDTQDGVQRRATRLGTSEAGGRDLQGGTLAASRDVAAIGLVGADNGAGRVAIFERGPDGTWDEAAVVFSEPESLPSVAGEVLECRDERAGLFPCSNIEVLSFMPVSALGGDRGIRLNDVWGWRDPETGQEYALVGRTDGLAFVDITNRLDPVFVGDLPRTQGSPTAAWRDMKVYRDHVFVVADASGRHGMQIFDLTRLRDFDGEPVSHEPDLTYDRIHSAHNIVVNEATGFAYTVGNSAGGETCGGGLHMIDISEPLDPTFVGCFADPQTGRSATGYTHDAQCVIYHGPHEAYRGREICFGANETALSVADVTDKENPVALSRAAYPHVGYSHQVWLTEDHEYLYMNDELDVLSGMVDRTRTVIWDVRDLEDPQVAGEYFSPVSASAHNLYIVGDLMYQSNYASGLRIVDISERDAPREVGYLDTAPFVDPEPGFQGSWSNFPFFEDGTVAVTSIQEGLYLIRYVPSVPVS
jgi:choice-of-anchor B domain-containing protein